MRAHFDLGLSHFVEGKPDEAVKDFTVASLLHPQYTQAHYNLALAEYRTGNLVAAESEAAAALKLNAAYAKAYFLRGAISLRQGDAPTAKTLFETAARYTSDPVLKSLCRQIIAQIG
ncbi:MAG: tetratricopeptide repeat protein [Candidatus Eremiobacteraeota bacterium]|nr:tetratricopeptide repeat protein [Candidatus Eremiobacteraeota bacterium]